MLSGRLLDAVPAETNCTSIVFASCTPTGEVIASSDCEGASAALGDAFGVLASSAPAGHGGSPDDIAAAV